MAAVISRGGQPCRSTCIKRPTPTSPGRRSSENPQNRVETVGRQVCEAAGGKLLGAWYCFGEYDFVLVAEVPSNEAMSAIALAVTAGGAVKGSKTTVLMSGAEVADEGNRHRLQTGPLASRASSVTNVGRGRCGRWHRRGAAEVLLEFSLLTTPARQQDVREEWVMAHDPRLVRNDDKIAEHKTATRTGLRGSNGRRRPALAFGPLKGLRVTGTGQLIAQPYIGTKLAEFGAEVIHVQKPGGDVFRLAAPQLTPGKNACTAATRPKSPRTSSRWALILRSRVASSC